MDRRSDRDAIAALIDHTLLRPEATDEDIAALCREAAMYRFAFVCVNPVRVTAAAAHLEGTGVGVCSVVGFPLGATSPEVKAFETRSVVRDGAREVDMVIHVGALRSGALQLVEDEIAAVVQAAREGGAAVKVIVEAALLTDDEKVTACHLARRAGAQFVKTSTGFGPGGATVADVALMRRAVGPDMGVKASGGIRGLAALRAMVAAGATRVGTSAGASILREFEREER